MTEERTFKLNFTENLVYFCFIASCCLFTIGITFKSRRDDKVEHIEINGIRRN